MDSMKEVKEYELNKGYHIQRRVNTVDPSADVGKDVAFSFDYGVVHSKAFGEARVCGRILCFEKYVDKEALLNAEPHSQVTFGEVGVSILEDLKQLGGALDLENDKTKGFGISCDTADMATLLFPSTPITEMKVFLLTIAVLIQMDDGIDATWREGKNLEPVMRAYRGALSGEYTHLNQIDLLEIPDDMRNSIAFLILLRREALHKSEVTWTFLEREFLDFFQFVSVEHDRSFASVEDYLQFREYTNAARICIEAHWIAAGLEIPDEVRKDPDFHQFKALMSLCIGLNNDISALKKEVEAGEAYNIVIILAQTMPFQTAITESLNLLESTFFQAKQAARRLLQTYGEDSTVYTIIHTTGLCADYWSEFQELYGDRYGLEKASWYEIVEFNENFVPKKQELANGLPQLDITFSQTNLFDSKDTIGQHDSLNPGRNPKDDDHQPLAIPNKIMEPILSDPKLPKHLAFIPDGNRRWAKSKGMDPWEGHAATCNGAIRLLTACFERGIHSVTVWGLSPDNFKRPPSELNSLWFQFEKIAGLVREKCDEYGGRFCHIGNVSRIPARIMRIIRKNEEETKERTSRCVTLALDYGGINEIIQAVHRIEGSTRQVSPERITENLYASSKNVLYPIPDLVVRTGCKDSETVRMSGFMIWQASQAELYFESKYMPDVTVEDVHHWIDAYGGSEQRHGK